MLKNVLRTSLIFAFLLSCKGVPGEWDEVQCDNARSQLQVCIEAMYVPGHVKRFCKAVKKALANCPEMNMQWYMHLRTLDAFCTPRYIAIAEEDIRNKDADEVRQAKSLSTKYDCDSFYASDAGTYHTFAALVPTIAILILK